MQSQHYILRPPLSRAFSAPQPRPPIRSGPRVLRMPSNVTSTPQDRAPHRSATYRQAPAPKPPRGFQMRSAGPPTPPTYRTQLSYAAPPVVQVQSAPKLQSTTPQTRRSGASCGRIGNSYDPKKPVAAVVASLHSGGSYDDLFSVVPQESPDPSKTVSVFRFTYKQGPLILSCLQGLPIPQGPDSLVVQELVRDITRVQPGSVVFNWECCGGCNSHGFSEGDSTTIMDLVRLLMHRGHMCMFSDFSLKALIAKWSVRHLGPNPLRQIGEFSESFDLRFNPEVLKLSASAQLQRVGELCEEGKAVVAAMPATICFTVDPVAADTPEYDLQVLTVATRQGHLTFSEPTHPLCSVGEHEGAAGHVSIRYPSGGVLLLSSGHWLELVQLDVSVASLINAAARSYGAAYAANLSDAISSMPSDQQYSSVQTYARQMVQSASPCSYSS